MKLTNKQLTDTNLNLTSLLEINARINAKKKIKTTNISKKTHYKKKKKLTTSIRSQSSRSFALQNALAKHFRQATNDKV